MVGTTVSFSFPFRYIDTYKVFQYRPDNLYDNIDVRLSGKRITKEEVCGVDGIKCQRLVRPNNVEGTVVPTKSDSGVMFCLQSYHGPRIDRSLVY